VEKELVLAMRRRTSSLRLLRHGPSPHALNPWPSFARAASPAALDLQKPYVMVRSGLTAFAMNAAEAQSQSVISGQMTGFGEQPPGLLAAGQHIRDYVHDLVAVALLHETFHCALHDDGEQLPLASLPGLDRLPLFSINSSPTSKLIKSSSP
jgi:hypothetical protein